MTSPRGFREIEPTAADEEAAEEILETIEAVSYTHLTLPTT